MALRIGISGWTYGPWRGVFYPKGLAHQRELEYASRQVNSIEINGTFYSLQRPESFRAWREATPDDFVFSVKGGRFITHMKKLKDVRVPLANFFASGVLALREKLGPILWQFPPGFAFNEGRFDEFFTMLPRTTRQAAKLARGHDARLNGRAFTRADVDRPLRHAVEIRHESFRDERFVRLLRKHGIAFVFADTAGRWPYFEDLTADFAYVRLHGDEELYVSGYGDDALNRWAGRIRAWSQGKRCADGTLVCREPPKTRRGPLDVYVYFDNDVKVRAPIDAIALSKKLGLSAGTIDPSAIAFVNEQPRSAWPAARRVKKRVEG